MINLQPLRGRDHGYVHGSESESGNECARLPRDRGRARVHGSARESVRPRVHASASENENGRVQSRLLWWNGHDRVRDHVRARGLSPGSYLLPHRHPHYRRQSRRSSSVDYSTTYVCL